jgi:hemoglobin
MKKDIENKEDIKLLIGSFYSKVKKDDTLGFIFNEIFHINWETHLPIICDFWENVLFQSGPYTGNPMAVHKKLYQQFPLTKDHFKQWIKVFTETADELFEGDIKDLAIQRAVSIAAVMMVRISAI